MPIPGDNTQSLVRGIRNYYHGIGDVVTFSVTDKEAAMQVEEYGAAQRVAGYRAATGDGKTTALQQVEAEIERLRGALEVIITDAVRYDTMSGGTAARLRAALGDKGVKP